MSIAGIGRQQLCTFGAVLDHDAQNAGRESGGVGCSAKDERRERRERTRSKDDGVPGHQRRDQLLKRHDDGAVVGGDRTHDADGLVATNAQRHLAADKVVERNRIRFLVGEGLVEVDRLSTQRESHRDLRALSHHARLACLTHDRVDQDLLRTLNVVEKGMEDLGPLGDREVRPDTLVE